MSATPGEHTTYSKVISEFDNYNVSGYTLDLGSGELQYTLKSDNTKKYKYSVPNVSLFLQDTQGYRKAYNEKNPDSQLVEDFYPVSDNSFLLSFLPYLLMVALMIARLYGYIFTASTLLSTCLDLKLTYVRKIPVKLGIVKSVSHYEHIVNVKADIISLDHF